MFTDTIALEYKAFTMKQGLGKAIEDIFTDLLDAKKEIESKEKLAKYSFVKGATRSAAIVDYFNKVSMPALQRVVKEYCNIDLYRFSSSELPPPYNSPKLQVAGIGIFVDHEETVSNLIMRTTSTKLGDIIKPTSNLNTIYNRSMERLQTHDPSTGRLTIPVKATLMLDVVTLLFPEFVYSNEKGLTPGEITAILLHEIGHVYDIVLNGGNLFNNAYLLSTMYSQFIKLPLEQQTKLIGRNVTIIRNDIKNIKPVIDPKMRSKVIKQAEAILDVYQPSTLSTTLRLIGIVGTIRNRITFIWDLIVRLLKAMPTSMKKLYTFLTWKQLRKTLADIQTSRVEVESERSLRFAEIQADTFVGMHGYSTELITGLNKYAKLQYIKQITPNNDYTAIIKDTKILCFVYDTWYYVYQLIPPLITMTPLIASMAYEPIYKRYERVIQTMYSQLKDINTPPKTMKAIINEIERSKDRMTKAYTYHTSKYVQRFWNLITLVTPTEWLLSEVADARLFDEMGNLLDKLDSLISNPMYFHSAKLKLK